MSYVYGVPGGNGPFAGGGGSVGGAGAPYTPNQLLAQQYGQGSRAFYSPFNSPYRPMDVPAGQFQPPRGYGGGFGGMPSPQYGSPPGGGGMFGGMAGQLPPGMPGPSVYQPQMGMQQPTGAARDYYHALSQQMGGGGMAPGGFAPAQPGFTNPSAQGSSPQTGAQYGMEAMRNFQNQQNAGGTGQSARQYGLNAVQNFASQQNAGPPAPAYQPGSFSAGVAALNRGDANARNLLGQAAGLPPAPAQPFGPAFQNAVRQLQVQPPAPPQRLPYQPGASAQMMQLGRRRPPAAGPPVA
jgi:hypothetical protein